MLPQALIFTVLTQSTMIIVARTALMACSYSTRTAWISRSTPQVASTLSTTSSVVSLTFTSWLVHLQLKLHSSIPRSLRRAPSSHTGALGFINASTGTVMYTGLQKWLQTILLLAFRWRPCGQVGSAHPVSARKCPLTYAPDIDYMHLRWVFTLDEDRFPLSLMRQLVDHLHANQQHYIVMVDPAVAYQDYDAFNNGVEQEVFMTRNNGSIYKGVVWPGVT